MTPAVLTTPRRRASRERCAGDRGRGLTLEQRLGATLDAAEAGQAADCPVCQGSMSLRAGSAVCGDCGSQLS
jgi:hypothetical protein